MASVVRSGASRSDQILLSHVLVCGLMCVVFRHRVDVVSMTTIMLLLHSIVPFMPGQGQSAISQKQSMQCLVSSSVMHKGDGLEIQKDKVFCTHDCITKACTALHTRACLLQRRGVSESAVNRLSP